MKLVCLRMSGLTPTYDVAAAKVEVVAIARCHMITWCACTQYLVIHCHFYATLI